MNGRIESGDTPEERLAAVVVVELMNFFEERNRRESRTDIMDYADIASALRPYLQRELLHARLDEVRELRTQSRNRLVGREGSLLQKLAEVEGEIVRRKETTG